MIEHESIHQYANKIMREAFEEEFVEDMQWIEQAIEAPRCECKQCNEHLFDQIWERVEKWRVPDE